MTRKTRNAVQAALNHLENALSTKDGRVHFSDIVRVGNARALLAEALAEPKRECDMGTPDEQSERFDAHCRKYMGCKACPLRDADGSVPKHCEFRWAQTPYTEGGAK